MGQHTGQLLAAAQIARSQSFPKPANALCRGAVREAFGHDHAPGLPLQPVIADRAGGVQGLVDITGLQQIAGPVRVMP